MADFVQEHLDPARETVDAHLERFFRELREDPGLKTVGTDEAHRILESERAYLGDLEEYVRRGGKRLRPVSLYWAYRAAGGERDMDELYPLHLSVELFHNGTLIHDDLVDQDPTRRGGRSIHERYIDTFERMVPGNAVRRVREAVRKARSDGVNGLPRRVMAGTGHAIDAGNVMENLSRNAIHDGNGDAETLFRAQRILNRRATMVNFGQNLDLTMEQLSLRDIARHDGVYDGSLAERLTTPFRGHNHVYEHLDAQFDSWADAYIHMIDKKTVDLYTAAVEIGAEVAGATREQRATLTGAMRDIGRAFQIQDDYLEIEESAEDIGKEPTDIINGKLTLPAITTYEVLNASVDLVERGPAAFDTENLVRDYIAATGVETEEAAFQVQRATRGDRTAILDMHDAGMEVVRYADVDVPYLEDDVLMQGGERLRRDRDRFLDLYGDVSGQDDIDAVSDIITAYGTAKEWAWDYIHNAKATLQGSDLDPEYRAKFEGLADFMLERGY